MNSVFRDIVIRGSGCAVPTNPVTSGQRDEELGLAAGTVQRASGVQVRYVALSTDTSSSLAARAIHSALENARLVPSDIDCLVAANATMDQAMPYNAALIHKELAWESGNRCIFDIGASCMSFLAAVDQMSWPLIAGRYKNVLVVSSDISSCGLNWSHLEASAIFGDGAAAVIFSRADRGSRSGILSSNSLILSEGAHFCEIRGSGSRFHPARSNEDPLTLSQFKMNGKGVFKLVSKYLPHFVSKLCEEADVAAGDLDWIVPHQASLLAMKHLTERLGFFPQRVVDVFADRGNQVAASLPTALHLAIEDGRIVSGNTVLLIGTGAGVSIGGMILRI